MSIDIFANFPVFDLNDIILRELIPEDAKNYYNYMGKSEMVPFLTKPMIPKSLSDAENEVEYWGSLFRLKRSFYWAIALKENNQLIGTVGFNNISFYHKRGEISYDLDASFWKKGIMLKSVKTVLKFSDLILGLIRVQATVITNNQPSINLLERCSFKQEGLLKKYEIVEDIHKDYYMYGRV